ncbi:T9SS type A sorting domain-containing protein [Bacteroidales bacterium OttesenSCG-928-B11]|nr:T9SS type A sorting domain-containing protein [Bacteroidales bacterium OttesenSCG-928-E04]MDL2311250.1 T9SS type A sorting domain-containing protein [Bacteroidales bacterium OttesenSCG-928-B11]
MKKLYTTLIALLVVTALSAQQIDVQPVQHEIPQKFGAPTFKKNNDAKRATTTHTFNYMDDFFNDANIDDVARAEFGMGRASVIDCQTMYKYSNGNHPIDMGLAGQFFDFVGANNYDYWAQKLSSASFKAPSIKDLSGTMTYSIDSVTLSFAYNQGDSVADGFTDTLLITYSVNLDDVEPLTIINSNTQQQIIGCYMPKINPTTFEFDGLPSNATVITQRIILNESHLTGDYFGVFTFPAPAEFSNLTGKVLSIHYGMLPGTVEGKRDTINAVMRENVNLFMPYLYKMTSDLSYEHLQDGSNVLMNDLNTPYCTNYDSYYDLSTPTSIFHKSVIPMYFFSTYAYPYIGVTITCNDCEVISVKDIEKKNITVRPNPATNMFTVDLEDNGTAKIELFNLMGQMVYTELANDASVNVNVSNLNSGVYMLKITQDGKIYTSKVIVQ